MKTASNCLGRGAEVKGVRATVPASTSNLGPGFDTLGLAVGIRNEVRMVAVGPWRRCGRPEVSVAVKGQGGDDVPRGRKNLVYRGALEVFLRVRRCPAALRIELVNRIPTGSGLGSSAAAALGGMVAANALCGGAMGRDELCDLATAMEGHPDNVAPALYGGLTISVVDGNGHVHVLRPRVRRDIVCVFCIPERGVSTRRARDVLPARYARGDAVYSLSRAAMLAALLGGGPHRLFREAMRDSLHQRYRSRFVPGMEEGISAAEKAGALGACLSGAGPAVLALAGRRGHSERIGRAMVRALAKAGRGSEFRIVPITMTGARVLAG